METIKSVRVKFEKLKGETPKAFLLQVNGKEHWFPRKLCFNFILNKKLGGNMNIPAWLYTEKFGEAPSLEDAAVIIETHVPTRIEPINPKPDASLIR